jgi:nucleoside-diphosphate-sugar epimerase
MRNILTAPSSSSPWKVYEFDPGLMALSRSSLLSSPSPSAHPGALSKQGVESLLSSSHVLLSIPPLGLPNYDPVLQEQLKLMKEYTGLWVGYLSSTSVYGDWGGDWVDEMVVPNPKTAKGIQRRAAEEAWEAQDHLPLHIFRLGGIYGNGRSALDVARRKREEGVEGSQGGSSLNREAKRFTSRIHVVDICLAVEASMMQPGTGEKGRSLYYYNLVDDDPAPRSEVVRFAQDLIKLPGEDDVRVASSEGVVARSAKLPLEERETEEKRVSNARMKDLLLSSGLRMLYPSYKEGLQAILSENQ